MPKSGTCAADRERQVPDLAAGRSRDDVATQLAVVPQLAELVEHPTTSRSTSSSVTRSTSNRPVRPDGPGPCRLGIEATAVPGDVVDLEHPNEVSDRHRRDESPLPHCAVGSRYWRYQLHVPRPHRPEYSNLEVRAGRLVPRGPGLEHPVHTSSAVTSTASKATSGGPQRRDRAVSVDDLFGDRIECRGRSPRPRDRTTSRRRRYSNPIVASNAVGRDEVGRPSDAHAGETRCVPDRRRCRDDLSGARIHGPPSLRRVPRFARPRGS